jgi:hypothetical protein
MTQQEVARITALIVRLHLDGRRPWPAAGQVSKETGVPGHEQSAILEQLHARGHT